MNTSHYIEYTLDLNELENPAFESHQSTEATQKVMNFPRDAEYEPDSSSNDLSWMPKSSSISDSKDMISHMEIIKKNQEIVITFVDEVSTEESQMEEEIEPENEFKEFNQYQNVFIQIDGDSQVSALLHSQGKAKLIDDANDSNHSTTDSSAGTPTREDHRTRPRAKRENKTGNPEKNTSAPIMLIIQRMFDGWYDKKNIELEWTEKAKASLSKDILYRFGEFIGNYNNLKTWTQIRKFVAGCGDQEVVNTLKFLLNYFLVKCDKDEFKRCLNTTRLRDNAKDYLVGHRKAYYERFVSEIF